MNGIMPPSFFVFQWTPMLASDSQYPAREPTTLSLNHLRDGSDVLRGKHVVIVEDEGLTQLQLRKICLLAGMEVVGTAMDGAQGIQEVLQTRPDIVLMDIKMPILDGLKAAARILEEFSVCVVMLTAYDMEDYKAEAEELGTCGYIFKPVNATLLIPQLEAAYSQFTSRAEAH